MKSSTKAEIQEKYLQILRHPAKISTLEDWEFQELEEYIQKDIDRLHDFANGCLIVNPNYKYSKEWKGKEFEYWLTRSKNYEELEYVRNLLKKDVPTTALQAIFKDPEKYNWVLDNLGKRLSGTEWQGNKGEFPKLLAILKYQGYFIISNSSKISRIACETIKIQSTPKTISTKIGAYTTKLKNQDPQAFTPFSFLKSTQ